MRGKKMEFYTERLHIRPWKDSDAESLYEYAKNPNVGPMAGWPVHTSVENSLEIIHGVLSEEGTFAICLKEDDIAIGSIGIMDAKEAQPEDFQTEKEIGYWLGEPFWGRGLMPEAVRCIQKYCFEKLGCTALWCCHNITNKKSERCMTKCGFKEHHIVENVECKLMGDVRTYCCHKLTREDWMQE